MSSQSTPQELSPAARKRLQQLFDHGSRAVGRGNYEYAADLFAQCVVGDPGNAVYAQNLLGALQKFYNNNKKGARLAAIRGAKNKTALAAAARKQDWDAVFKNGVELLKLNPWDIGTLLTLADACAELGHNECAVTYLSSGLAADPEHAELNRKMAQAMERAGQFDKAMLYWRRVLKANPEDEQARKGLANAQVKKTITKGGYESAESAAEVAAAGQMIGAQATETKRSREEELQRAIKRNPQEVSNYIELADYYTAENRLAEAEQTLEKALEVSGGDLSVRERLEDARLRRVRENAAVAQQRAAEEKTEEAKARAQQALREQLLAELDYYRSRSERYPNQVSYRLELGLRLKRLGKYQEAIKQLQEARKDPRRKGEVLLSLGECFQQIKQYKLAMTNYEEALAQIPDHQEELKKRALYRAGRLALGLKNLDRAEELLTELAGMDFGYHDVAELLDKIRRQREEEE